MTVHNPIAISSGHGKYISGAVDIMNEHQEAVKVVNRVGAILSDAGVDCVTFEDTTSRDQNTNLHTIVDWHNAQDRTLDVSVHFNSNGHTSKPLGTMCLYVTQADLATAVAGAVAAAGGFINKGKSYRSDLYFLNNTTKPSILIETCFVTSQADVDLYHENFEAICQAIAETIYGKSLAPQPEPEPEPEPDTEPAVVTVTLTADKPVYVTVVAGTNVTLGAPEPEPPEPEPGPTPEPDDRPTIARGDYGHNVVEVQQSLGTPQDGDFGSNTENAVMTFQRANNLTADGVVGPSTWGALKAQFGLPDYPPPLPPLFSQSQLSQITQLAGSHIIARYSWRDRGQAPPGYTKGMAVAYAQAYVRHKSGDPIAAEWGKANTGNDSVDALSWYNSNFSSLGLDNEEPGVDTMRHLYVLLIGLGMRESSGQHCCGRDQSASNTDSNTCEAGLFQTSWNASTCCTDFLNLADQYDKNSPQGYMGIFSEGVSCSSSDWACYGGGDGYKFQECCKYDPTFAVETAAITLRNLRQHYGPINRKEAELRKDADDMFWRVQNLVDGFGGVA